MAEITVCARIDGLQAGQRTALGNKHVAMKVVASYAEDQLITSDPRQLLEIEEAKKEFNESLAEGQA